MGLFWTGEWARCEAAVDAVLTGSKTNGVAISDWRSTGTLGGGDHVLPSRDIRHVPRVTTGLAHVREKTQFKRTGKVIKPQPRVGLVDSAALWKIGWDGDSVETVEPSLLGQVEPNPAGETGLNLELTLGFHCQSAHGNTRSF